MRGTLGYYAFMALAGVLGIVKGLALAKILGMAEFGAYGLAIAAGAAFQFMISMGATEGLNMLLPPLIAQGKEPAVGDMVRSIGKMVILRGLAATVIAWPLLVSIHQAPLFIGALIGTATALTTVPIVHARCRGNLQGFGLSMFLKALATLVASCTGGWIAGTTGALLGECMGMLLAILRTWPTELRHGNPTAADILAMDDQSRKEGKALLIQGANGVVQQNVERWFVTATLGLEGMGRYGLAQLFVTSVNLVHATFFQQAGAKILPQMAAGKPPREAMREMLRFAATLGAATFLALFVSSFFVPFFVHWLAPQASNLNWCLFWLAAGAIAQMLHYSDWLLIASRRQPLLEKISWISTLFSILCFGFGWITSETLEYFLFAYFLGRVFFLTSTFWIARRIINCHHQHD